MNTRQPNRANAVEVGSFTSRATIVVYREPEVGIAWEAEARGLGRAALGDTPREAAHNLVRALNADGVAGEGQLDSSVLEGLSPDA